MTIYATLDGPGVHVHDRQFAEGLAVVGQPITYGRVLFRQHDVLIERCRFMVPGPESCLHLDGVYGALITENRFEWGGVL